MKRIRFQSRTAGALCAILLLLGVTASSVGAQETLVRLEAGEFVKTMSDGTQVAMWGYRDRDVAGSTYSSPGPQINVPAGNTLRVNLRNLLPVPVSIMIPGQKMPVTPSNASPVSVRFPNSDPNYAGRIRSFVQETPAGTTRNFVFEDLKPGTFLYHSGTHPYLQVQMGLLGMATVEAAPGEAYPGETFDAEIPLIYSEIDVDWHVAIAGDPALGTPGDPLTGMTVDYEPDYALVNGQTFDSAAPAPVATITAGDRCLVRCVNAGLEDHSLSGLERVDVIAEDGNAFSTARSRLTVFLAASKTKDVVLTAGAVGTLTFFDRLGAVSDGPGTSGGLITKIQVDAAP